MAAACDELVDLAVLLEDRLEKRQAEPGLDVERHRPRGDVLAGPAQHERVEQLVGDQVASGRVVLGPPCRRDPVAELARRNRPGGARRPTAPTSCRSRTVHALPGSKPRAASCRRVTAGSRPSRSTAGHVRLSRPRRGAARGCPRSDGIDSAGRARYPSAFCPASSTNCLAIRRDHDRDPVGRREHRLDRRQARRRRRKALAGPQRPDLVDRGRDALRPRPRARTGCPSA